MSSLKLIHWRIGNHCCVISSLQWLNSKQKFNNRTRILIHNSKISTYERSNLTAIKDLNNIYPEQEIEIATCGDLYKKWEFERKFRRIPKDSLKIPIKYVDTSVSTLPEYQSPSLCPVIFAMHGIPGNYGVFSHLINYFGRRARVIIPTFPNSLYYPTINNEEGLFRHSVHEKCQVYKDFLAHLGIPRIDVLVAHSCGIYPCLKLILDESAIPIKSLALFHPGGYQPVKLMKPMILTTAFGHISLNRSIHPFITKHSGAVIELIRPKIRANLESTFLLAVTMTFSEFRKTEQQFKEVSEKQIPTLLVFSEGDTIVDRPVIHNVLKTMQYDRTGIWHYDKEGVLIKKGCEDNWMKAVTFDTSSHYVFRKYPEISNLLVGEHLDKVLAMKNNFNYNANNIFSTSDTNLLY